MRKTTLNNRSRAGKDFQRHSRGFTLVEVLLTIAFIGAISVAFFSFMSAAASALIRADERAMAESLARSQLEFIKNNGYNSSGIYPKILNIPPGYSICCVNSANQTVNCAAAYVVGIPWDSENNRPATDGDKGLQKIALAITHKDKNNQDKVIYTFINSNPNWANGVKITLEGYIRKSGP